MPKSKSENTMSLEELKIKLSNIKLNIRSGQEKNTNAHKKTKVQIAQLLTKNQQLTTNN
ncbi:hypothetical protein GW844_01040 [bacterium]|nr:hypothetical protein [bacterium]